MGCSMSMGFPGGSEVKASACNVGDLGLIPGSGRSAGEGNGNLLQDSCLENPMDGGTWWATVHGVTKSRTQLSDFTSLHFYEHTGSSDNGLGWERGDQGRLSGKVTSKKIEK